METRIQKHILENSPNGYCILNISLEMLSASPRFLELFRSPWESLKDLNWIELILEKNFQKKREKAFLRWFHLKLNTIKTESTLVSRIIDDFRSEFFIVIKPLYKLEHTEKEFLISIFPLGDVMKLLKERLNQKVYREYRIAGKIQRNLNDYIIEMIEGRFFKYHFNRVFLPSSYLSGDIVNIKTVSRRYSSMFIGDGRGHGLPAALYSSLINSYLNIIAKEVSDGNDSPARLLEDVNKNAYRDFTGSGEYYFFSGFYGLIDGNGKDFTFTNAGHPHPVLVRNGVVTRLDTNGPIVGVFEDAIYSENKLELQDDDMMIFFTDGFYELFPDNHMTVESDGITGIIEGFLTENNNPDLLIDFLKKLINRIHSKSIVNDDVTILFLKVEGKNINQ
jgi:serine phosphatase RsbU (regulator of sigma subunit)